MTLTLRHPDALKVPQTGPFARPDRARTPLARLQAAAESAFLDAGRNLEATVEELHALRAQFDRLHQALGPGRSGEFHARIAAVNDQIAALRADLADFGTAADTLHGAVRAIATEVEALDRVMRTIAIVSINARIHGNSLVPARPQVSAFIQHLGRMSEEADVILREVNHTMSATLDDIAALGQQHHQMVQALHRDVLPEIARFSQMSERMRDGQAALHQSAQELSAQMAALFADVSRLVVALQIGDATRQRLECAEATITLGEAAPPARQALLIDLGQRLIAGARSDARAEIDAALVTLADVKDRAMQALRSAASGALGQTAHGRGPDGAHGAGPDAAPSTGVLAGRLCASQTQFAALRARTIHVHDQLDSILRHEPALRRIANEIRLAGINAIIACAKLGQNGRTLRELAQWLRGLTDESDAIVLRLQGVLASSQAIIRNVGEARIAAIDRSLSVFLEQAGPLAEMIQETRAVVAATSRGFTATTRRLPDRVDAARKGLTGFLGQIGDLDGWLHDLSRHQAALPPPAWPGTAQDEAMLVTLRGRYTMAQERRVHDLWEHALRQGAVETLRGSAPDPALDASPDALMTEGLEDDVFF